ncbi:Transposon Tf2-9 polyprotein [Araneus ventricosus]|uniref:RNA-directed DNA polymerase n=1 Tax=Araneus ventricosus TaxID=182803 RepID=A0A4Y2WQ32_ARAVE|nr:Transposon Tf2-9 polyprotein [Araneus ventricosus]
MAFLLARRKEDLMTLAADLHLTFEASFTKLKLKELIVKSPDYVEDDVKKMLDGIVEERTKGEEKAEKEKMRKEEREEKIRKEEKEEKIRREEKEERMQKEEREYELEKLRIQAHPIANIPKSAENVQTPNKPIHETFHEFNMQEDISLNLTLFERHAELTFLPKKDWIQKLIGLIPIEIAHLIAREPADKSYSKIAKSLSDLIRSDNPFVFEQPQIEAFEKLKKLLTESPVLSIFQQGKTTELHTDASQQGYGAVLLQEAEDGKLHPVPYMSKKTTPAEEKYSSYELEVLAVVNALRKFRTYLMGNHFKIITDCSAFQRTMDKKDLVTRITRWALLLEEFDYEIVHRSGQRMQHVDALSWYPVAIITSDTLTARLKRAQQEDEYTQSLRSMIGSNSDSDFFDKNEILYKYVDGRELIVVPRDMQTEIIKLAHEKGHFSAAKTEGVVKQEFFIPNLSKQVQNVIFNCVPCILTNKKSGKKDGFLNPIPKEDVPLSTYHVDFIGPLPSTNKKYQHILTIVDAFTKFTWLYPVKSTSAEDALDKLKVQQKTFGNPKRIIRDRGSAFTSKAFGDYCTNENIQHFQITTGVPRGNGQVERIHRTLIPVLTKLSIADLTKWFKFVDPLQRILNSTFKRSTKWSPFELLIGVTIFVHLKL